MPSCLPVDDAAKPAGYCNSVDRGSRTLAKSERQRLIASVVSRRRIGSQLELQAALERSGCAVTQATISRDVRELRLEKTNDLLGRPRYVLPERARTDPREALVGVLGQFGVRATAAGQVVVVHSELGTAPAIGRALDRLEHPRIVGTLAGDDTCLVITRNERDARALARELSAAIS
jgi:transcriptional regulator of arginine metabolism